MMLAFLKRSPKGLKLSRRALVELAIAIRRHARQRNTLWILPPLEEILGRMKRELDAYETRVSEGGGMPTAARGFHFWLSELETEFKYADRDLKAEGGLTPSSRSPLEPLYEPLEKLRAASRQLNGPETDFKRELNKQIKKSGVTPYAVAAYYDRDPGFIYKLMKGERRKPSRESVTRIATALMECSSKISEKDANRLMRTAGYPPLKR